MIPASIVVAILVIVAVLIWLAFRSAGKMVDAQAARYAAAQPGMATITEIHRRGISQDSRHVVNLAMRVTPAVGAPYDANVSWWLDVVLIPQAQPGMEIPVRVDATDPNRVYPEHKSWSTREAEYFG